MSTLKIVYEDDDLILFDKPQGIPTTPGEQVDFCSMVFESHPVLKKIPGHKPKEGGLLNRLDNETGGIVFFAKSHEAFLYYLEAMNQERIEKYYLAIVEGILDKPGRIQVPIAHHAKNAKKMTAVQGKAKFRGTPQPAETSYIVLEKRKEETLLEVKITKGVRHQIRVHLASIGHPIKGDKIYSKSPSNLEFHCLYAYRTIFKNRQGKTIDVSIPKFF